MRALALAGGLLLGASTLPAVAQAAIIVSNGGESMVGTGSAAGVTSTTVVTTPNPSWKPTVGDGAQWVSWNAGTGAGPTTTTSNGSTMTISESFSLAESSALGIKALADDRADIRILDSLSNTVYSFTSPIGANGPCNLVVMGCIDATQLNATTAVLAAGNYVFEMFVYQTNGSSFGANYAVSNVPLPAAALLFGSALAGLGVARRRKAEVAAA